jgi:ABC-type branched-subunit amino acid transport system substrate-binding protein
MTKTNRRAAMLAVAAMGLIPAFGASAQQTVKIGVIYPLSGNAASAGNYSKMSIELGADIVNKGDPELAKLMPLAKGGGLSGLGGAKIELVTADNQGTPQAGANQTLRLITQDKVVAVVGSYQSGITLTASAIAEKYGIPFLAPESVAANLTERGFKWFYRVTPVAVQFAEAYSAFLREQKAAGKKVDSIAIVHENTEYGNSISSVITEVFGKDKLNITQNISYSANSTDVQPQVLQLKEKNPDVVIFVSYTSDAILYTKTMKELNWKPAIMLADDAGFNDPAYVKTMGPQVLRRRQARQRRGDLRCALQEEDWRRWPRRRLRPRAGRLPGAGRRDQPCGLDRSGEDPRGARRDRPQGRPDGGGLPGREVRRQGPERAGLERAHPDEGRPVPAGLAEGQCDHRPRPALQGLVKRGWHGF